MMGKWWENVGNDGGSWILDDFRVFPTTLATQIKHDSSMRRICERLVVKKIRRNGKTVCDLHLPVCSICSIFQTQNSLKMLKVSQNSCWLVCKRDMLVLCRVFLDHHRNQEAWVVDVSRGSCLAKMSRWCPICAELTGKASNMMVFQCIAVLQGFIENPNSSCHHESSKPTNSSAPSHHMSPLDSSHVTARICARWKASALMIFLRRKVSSRPTASLSSKMFWVPLSADASMNLFMNQSL